MKRYQETESLDNMRCGAPRHSDNIYKHFHNNFATPNTIKVTMVRWKPYHLVVSMIMGIRRIILPPDSGASIPNRGWRDAVQTHSAGI